MKVLIINQCATNKGDRAVLFFLLKELVRNGVDDITVSTTDPHYWADLRGFPEGLVRFVRFGWSISSKRRKQAGLLGEVVLRIKRGIYANICFPLVRRALLHGVCSWYVRFLCTKEYWQAVSRADLVMSTGGHRVTTLLVRDAVFPATFDMAIVLLKHKPLVLWSQSIGPLKFRRQENRMMIEMILSSAWRILIRDKVSEEELSKVGVSMENVSQTRESVFGLFDIVEKPKKPSDRERIMGISVYMAQKRSYEENEVYFNSISAVVDHAAENGYLVRFFPMEMSGADQPCIEQIIERCRNRHICSIVEGYPETVEHMAGVAQCRIFLGHKTHSVVFALTTGTPLIAVAYHEKTEDFMGQFGLSEYCIPESQATGSKLIELFSKVSSNLDEISERELKRSREVGSRVREDFRKVIDDVRREFK